MGGRKLSPGAHATGKITGITGSPDREITFTSDGINYFPAQTVRERMEVQGNRRRHNTKFMTGELTGTLVTDDPEGTATWMQNVESATMTLTLANNRVITLTGVTFATAEGVREGITEGTTNELTWTFENSTDVDRS